MKQYGLTGPAGSGKDTAGDMLADMLGQETAAIAAPMKQLVHILFNVSPEQQESRIIKEKPMTWLIHYDNLMNCAGMYHSLGLDKYEAFHDAFDKWIVLLDIKLPETEGPMFVSKSLRQIYQSIGTEWGRATDEDMWINLFPRGKIATDVRMANEARALIKDGYEILSVINDSVTPVNKHGSENGLPKEIEVTKLPNNGTLQELRSELEKTVEDDLR